MQTLMLRIGLSIGLLLTAAHAAAAASTPLGRWQQIDDKTGKPRSIIQISADNGELHAVVKQILNRTPADIARDGQVALCKACHGSRKNQPIEGMTIMWGVKRHGDVWDGGNILDPSTGSTYRVTLKLLDGGNRLRVRGYLGLPILGRTQLWERQL